MQQKRECVLFFLPCLLASALSGCSGISTPGPDEPEEKPHADSTLRVSCPDEFSRGLVVESSRGWSRRVGLTSLDVALHDPDAADGPPPAADVWVIHASSLGRLASKDLLATVPDSFTAFSGPYAWSGLLQSYSKQLLTWGGKVKALPLAGDAPLFFYRRDLLGVNPPPRSWDEFLAHAEATRDATKKPSLPPLPKHPRDLERLFLSIAASTARRAVEADGKTDGKRDVVVERDVLFDFLFNEKESRPRIATKGFVAALRVLQRMQACAPKQAEDRPWQHFRDGRALFCLGDARLLAFFQADDSPIKGRVGVRSVPGSLVYYSGRDDAEGSAPRNEVNRVPFLGAGAYLMAVPTSAKHPDAAWELLEELSGRAGSQQIVLDPRWGGGAVRTAHLDEHFDCWRLPAGKDDNQAMALRAALRETLQSNLRNPVLCLRLPQEAEFRTSLATIVSKAVQAGEAATDVGALETLRAIDREWRAIIAGNPSFAKDLQTSLGL